MLAPRSFKQYSRTFNTFHIFFVISQVKANTVVPTIIEESSDEDPATLADSVGHTEKLNCPEAGDDDEAKNGTTFQTCNNGKLFTINLLGRFDH